MALTHAEPRLAPLGNTFQVYGEAPHARKRSHSYSGYTPHRLQLPDGDDQEPGPDAGCGSRCGSHASSPCAAAYASDGSTLTPESRASEAPSSPRDEHDGAGDLGEEGAPEPWPDTDADSDAEECGWSPCSRGRAPRCAREAPLQILATSPASAATFCSPAAAAAPWAAAAAAVPCAPIAPMAPMAGVLPVVPAPPGAFGLPLAQAVPRVPPPPAPAPLVAPALALPLVEPRWPGGQAPAVPAAAPAAWGPAPAAGDLPAAMRAAASALAALEAAEAEAEGAPAGAGSPARRGGPQPRAVDEGMTSLMLHGLPREVSQRELLGEVHRSGFAGRCDFLYMPRDFSSGKNRGHAFLNFTSSAAAAEFCWEWRGRHVCAGRAAGQSGIEISAAALQGLAANAAKWDTPRMRRVRNPDYKPFILDGGAVQAAGLP